jgi:subtilisin family serine protease
MLQEPTLLAVPTLEQVGLTALMALTAGSPDIVIGLIDGLVAVDHPDLAGAHIRQVGPGLSTAWPKTGDERFTHGTSIAGILVARRGADVVSICPRCQVLSRPLFTERTPLTATPTELSTAIVETVAAGARILNLSLALTEPWFRDEPDLEQALDWASRRDVVIVAAAGNQLAIASSILTRHPAVIPVVAYDRHGRPLPNSNVGLSIGKRGIGAPGDEVAVLGAPGEPPTSLSGTSAAVPFVTGTIALLASRFPAATAADLRGAVTGVRQRRRSVVPPLLDAQRAYVSLQESNPFRGPPAGAHRPERGLALADTVPSDATGQPPAINGGFDE